MIQFYLKIAWRTIRKEKWLSLINVFGLSVGISAFILLYVYIKHETGFDRFHRDGERIYRVISSFGGDVNNILPRTLPGVAQLLKDQVPQIEEAVRMKPEGYKLQRAGQPFEAENFLFVDSSFVDFFHFHTVAGDLAQSLADPSSIAITQGLAEKLFGDENPLDQIIEVESFVYDLETMRLSSRYSPVRVGAIFTDLPKNTHVQFSVLQSFDAYDPTYLRTFSNDVFVYFKTSHVLDESSCEQIRKIIKNYAISIYGENYRDILNYSVQPLHDIHFGPKYGYDMGVRGNMDLIYVFSAVAIFILFIAIINFVNLVTARSEKRAVEAAIRKVSGADRLQIMIQFLGESVLISLIALMMALTMAEILIGPFSNLLGRDLSLLQSVDMSQVILFVLFAPVIGIIAGAYPALVFSRFQPIEILRGKARGGSKNPLLRIILVVIQFGISVILIVTVMVFNRQIQYMKNADLGFTSENMLVLSGLSDRLVQGFDAMKAEMLMHPAIVGVSSSQAFPGGSGSGMSLRTIDQSDAMSVSVQEYRVGKDFQETYGIKIIQGRWFDFDLQTDLDNFVINETAAKAIGVSDPVGQEVVMWKRTGKVIGVVEDFHMSSLKNEIRPLVLSAYSSAFYHISVKLAAHQQAEAVTHIQNILAGFDSNYVFHEWYLEDYFQNLYRQEENNNKILNYASMLAIIIAMLGVLGLSSYIILARKKEIGVRKVFGAANWEIIIVLLKDITRWVVLANLIAWPVAWLFVSNWLADFPYRIHMSAWYLVIAGIISLLITLITVSGQTLMAARKNPVDALRGE